MFLRILILISLGLQLVGAFFLATHLVPKAWIEQTMETLQGKRARLLKKKLMRRKQLENFIDQKTEFIIRPSLLTHDRAISVDLSKIIKYMSKAVREVRESQQSLIPVMLFVALLGVWFWLFFVPVYIYAISIRTIILLVIAINSLYIERIFRIVSYFSKKQGEQIFALLGIFLLAVGFIFQATTSWLAIK